MEKYKFKVDKPNKLLKFLSVALQQYSYSTLQQANRNKDILVNGKREKSNVCLQKGDVVEIYLNQTKKLNKYEVYYQDDNIIVFNKRRGIEVCDGEFNILTDYQNLNLKIYAIHRLDRNTSGLVVFAKSIKVKNELLKIFKAHKVKKYYYAIVKRREIEAEGTFSDFLQKDAKNSIVKIYNKKINGASPIQTQYKVLKNNDKLSLVEVVISSGKTHQIRAQLAYHGMPILGDEKYGDAKFNKLLKENKQLLQAYKIEFLVNENSFLKYLNNLKLELDCEFKVF